ncbi:hypothetical protein Hanom_Chr02g00118041 [Helianthus anomalus]
MVTTSGGECVKILQLSDETRIEPSKQVPLKIPETPNLNHQSLLVAKVLPETHYPASSFHFSFAEKITSDKKKCVCVCVRERERWEGESLEKVEVAKGNRVLATTRFNEVE